jgi:hypothetical protein
MPNHLNSEVDDMNRYVIREYESGTRRVLLALPKLIERLALTQVMFWAFRQITFTCASPFFGIPVPNVEKLSSALSRGLILANSDFQLFLKTDMQILDGIIEAYADSAEPLCRIECVDASQWEISTNDLRVAAELEKRGFAIALSD